MAATPGVRGVVRWGGASLIMFASGGRLQLFPHMTMAYKAGVAG